MTPWLSTVLTTSDTLPACDDVLSALHALPGYGSLECRCTAQTPDRFLVETRCGTQTVTLAVALTEAQTDAEANLVQLSTLRRACARAWHWVEAGPEVRRATRQIAVVVQPEGTQWDALDVALLLTALTVAVVRALGESAVAVYWNSAGMLHQPAEFVAHAGEMSRRAIPVELWVEFRMVPNADATVSYGTWGLGRFRLDEMDVSRSRRETPWVLGWLFNLAHFMLENGPIVEHTHTFGADAGDRFTVVLGPSAPELGRDPDTRVFLLDFEQE